MREGRGLTKYTLGGETKPEKREHIRKKTTNILAMIDLASDKWIYNKNKIVCKEERVKTK